MPQTREHPAVLRGARRARGVVAITKADLADPALATAEAARAARRGAESSPARRAPGPGSTSCAPRSTASRRGLPRARGATARRCCTSTARSRSAAPARVVTGTLWSGSIGRGDELLVAARGRARARARGPGPRRARRARGGGPARRGEPAQRRPGRAATSCSAEPLEPAHILDVELDERKGRLHRRCARRGSAQRNGLTSSPSGPSPRLTIKRRSHSSRPKAHAVSSSTSRSAVGPPGGIDGRRRAPQGMRRATWSSRRKIPPARTRTPSSTPSPSSASITGMRASDVFITRPSIQIFMNSFPSNNLATPAAAKRAPACRFFPAASALRGPRRSRLLPCGRRRAGAATTVIPGCHSSALTAQPRLRAAAAAASKSSRRVRVAFVDLRSSLPGQVHASGANAR